MTSSALESIWLGCWQRYAAPCKIHRDGNHYGFRPVNRALGSKPAAAAAENPKRAEEQNPGKVVLKRDIQEGPRAKKGGAAPKPEKADSDRSPPSTEDTETKNPKSDAASAGDRKARAPKSDAASAGGPGAKAPEEEDKGTPKSALTLVVMKFAAKTSKTRDDKANKEEESDPGEKAPKGDSSEEDDEILAEFLQETSKKVSLKPRSEARSQHSSSDVRSDVAAVAEAEKKALLNQDQRLRGSVGASARQSAVSVREAGPRSPPLFEVPEGQLSENACDHRDVQGACSGAGKSYLKIQTLPARPQGQQPPECLY